MSLILPASLNYNLKYTYFRHEGQWLSTNAAKQHLHLASELLPSVQKVLLCCYLPIPNTRYSSLHRPSLPFLECPANGTLQCTHFWTILLSFICIFLITHVLFSTVKYTSVYLSCWWAIGLFPLWHHYEQNSQVHLCPSLLVDIGIQISCVYTLENCWIIQVDVYIYFIRFVRVSEMAHRVKGLVTSLVTWVQSLEPM